MDTAVLSQNIHRAASVYARGLLTIYSVEAIQNQEFKTEEVGFTCMCSPGPTQTLLEAKIAQMKFRRVEQYSNGSKAEGVAAGTQERKAYICLGTLP